MLGSGRESMICFGSQLNMLLCGTLTNATSSRFNSCRGSSRWTLHVPRDAEAS